jgi:Spy/CpxP family protein refolding chaperone
MTSARNQRRTSVAPIAAAALLFFACGGEAPPAAAPAPSAAPVASAPTAPPPPAPVAAASAEPPAPAPVPGATGEIPDADHHRRHNAGGVPMLILLSVSDLDLTADQKTAVEKIRDEMKEKMAPARAAEKELSTVLADGVAAGSVDKAKADKAIEKLVAAAQQVRTATVDGLVKLHAALTPAQRADLVDKLQQHFEKWKAAQGQEETDDKEYHSGHLLALVRELSLSQDEAQKIKDAFKAQLAGQNKGAKTANHDKEKRDEHKEVTDHLAAFEKAFKSDKFDPKVPNAAAADKHMAKWGASRRAAFLEAAAPILTPDQRTKLADRIRAAGDEGSK